MKKWYTASALPFNTWHNNFNSSTAAYHILGRYKQDLGCAKDLFVKKKQGEFARGTGQTTQLGNFAREVCQESPQPNFAR